MFLLSEKTQNQRSVKNYAPNNEFFEMCYPSKLFKTVEQLKKLGYTKERPKLCTLVEGCFDFKL